MRNVNLFDRNLSNKLTLLGLIDRHYYIVVIKMYIHHIFIRSGSLVGEHLPSQTEECEFNPGYRPEPRESFYSSADYTICFNG